KGWVIIKSSKNKYYAQKGENIYSGFNKDLNKLIEWIDTRGKIMDNKQS
ncbi:unnamed protein product, partial [marine sediment metagenome]